MITGFYLGPDKRDGWIETHNLPCFSNYFIVDDDGRVAFDNPFALHDTDRKELARRLTAAGVRCVIQTGKARCL